MSAANADRPSASESDGDGVRGRSPRAEQSAANADRPSASESDGDGVRGRSPRAEQSAANADRPSASESDGDGVRGRSPRAAKSAANADRPSASESDGDGVRGRSPRAEQSAANADRPSASESDGDGVRGRSPRAEQSAANADRPSASESDGDGVRGRSPRVVTSSDVFDIAVIGGGVVGTAAARLLSRHRLRVILIERGFDVGAGTSKANTAILHTGFDATPGSVESRLVSRGYHLLKHYAAASGIAVEPTGALLVAWDDEQAASLPKLAAKAAANGYESTVLVDATEIYALEPRLGAGARGGLLVPDEHIIDPWSTPLAFGLDALANGAVIRRSCRVIGATIGADVTTLATTTGPITTRFVVNAAGLHGDTVHRMFGFDGFTIRPRRGELIVFDKLARPLLGRTILPVPTTTTKGVLVAPTVFGNVMLGPTADDIDDRSATASTAAGLAGLLAKGTRIFPSLAAEEVTAVYAGLRAATEHSDYQLSSAAEARYVCLGGIRSTGLTASMALAEETVQLLQGIGLTAEPRPADEIRGVTMTNLGEAFPRPYMAGGAIICHCERVTGDEIAQACGGPLPAVDLDGVRRRTRALAGRCQGFYCTAAVVSTVVAASGQPAETWLALV